MTFKTRLPLLLAALFSTAVLAQEPAADAGGDAARQQRMDEAYRNHQARSSGTTFASAEEATKRDAREAGHAVHEGARATGHAIRDGVRATGHGLHQGVKATGHAIHQGVRATGHAIHEGVDKVTGK
jgi:hypothetical protein